MSILPEVVCIQLSSEDTLTAEQLQDIATLIYETDPFIYPAMFETEENAKRIIPGMIRHNDSMFNAENFFIAKHGENILGLILWHRGPMSWDETEYYQVLDELHLSPSPFIEMVKKGYFSSYDDTDDNLISIINVCVQESMRGSGIGRMMLRSFLKRLGDNTSCELYVLADNRPAIRLYEQCGFVVTDNINGFSVDNRDLPCKKMVRL